MKKFKKLVAILGLATMTMAAVGCNSTEAKPSEGAATEQKTQEDKDKENAEAEKIIVAKVNDQTISLAELNTELVYLEQIMMMQFGPEFKQNEEAMTYYKEQQKLILDYLVESKLVVQQADENGISITDEEINEQIEQIKAANGLTTDEAFTTALSQQGMTPESYKEFVKESLIIAQTMEQVTKDAAVNEDEAKTYYEENIAKYTTAAGANMAHILVATEDEAKSIKKEYEEGKTFEELAAQYGTDGTKDQGGALGFIPNNSTQYDADFLAGAKDLKEGEVSGPVKTQFGYHLIKTTGLTDEVVAPFEEAKTSAEQAVLQEKQYKLFEAYINSVREKAEIEIFEDKLN
ncbi:MAG: peptidyl-prolyl cis-trans isomerase [Cellulosilyticaceae bacterium]